MGSSALNDWQGRRSDNLDRLLAAHQAVGGQARGRRWFTAEINHALVTRLAGEFQGFSRDLYLESVAHVADAVDSTALSSVVRQQLGLNLQLQSKNAQSSSVGADFGRLGAPLFWEDVDLAFPEQAVEWRTTLDDLNAARNAIVHQDDMKLRAVQVRTPLTLRTVRSWRRSLRSLAEAMDEVVGSRTERLTGVAPW